MPSVIIIRHSFISEAVAGAAEGEPDLQDLREGAVPGGEDRGREVVVAQELLQVQAVQQDPQVSVLVNHHLLCIHSFMHSCIHACMH